VIEDHWQPVRDAKDRTEFVEALIDAICVEIANRCLASPSPKGRVTAAIKQEFEEQFWPNLPKGHKLGKGAALKAYAQARSTTEVQAILDGLPAYTAHEAKRKKQDGIGFRPLHPATWLHAQRWLDEMPEGYVAQGTRSARLCACGCGLAGQKNVSGQWFATTACRKKVLGW